MKYFEKLKDPRWQRKRLEIFQRDDFTCQSCGSKNKTLHAHHLCYFKGHDPWDYDNFFIITLCEDCHEIFHNEHGFSEYFLKKKFDRISFELENFEEQKAYDISGIFRFFKVDHASIPSDFFNTCILERKYDKEKKEISFKIIKEES